MYFEKQRMRQTFSADLGWCRNICLWCVGANDGLEEKRGVLAWLSEWWEQIQLCISSTGHLTTTELLPRISLLWRLANTIPHLLCVEPNPPWLEWIKCGAESQCWHQCALVQATWFCFRPFWAKLWHCIWPEFPDTVSQETPPALL